MATDTDTVAKVSKESRELLNKVAEMLVKNSGGHEPTLMFAKTLAALTVADVTGCLDELYRVAEKSIGTAKKLMAITEDSAKSEQTASSVWHNYR